MKIPEYIEMIEQQNKETDDIYKKLAAYFGLSDAALWVLYTITKSKNQITQHDLCRSTFYSKQTVNSVINKFITDGYVKLEALPNSKRSKKIILTEKGETFGKNTISKLFEAEIRAYGRFNDEELKKYLEISAKITSYLREETDKIVSTENRP